MKYKRIAAYLIDFMVLCVFVSLLSMLLQNSAAEKIEMEMGLLHEQFLMKKIDFISYLNSYSILLHDFDRNRILVQIFSILFMIGYYTILPYKNRGRTLGKMCMHIEVYKEGGTKIDTFLVRSLLIDGLFYMFLSSIFVFLLPSFAYFLTVSILGILQIILVGVSTCMLLYKKDGKALHDMLTCSYVREYDEVRK